MSKRQVNSRVPEHVADAVEELQRDRRMEHFSEAAQEALVRGLAEFGYLGEGVGLTPARRLAKHVYRMLFYVAATLAILTFSYGLQFGVPAISVATGSLAIWLGDRVVLTRVEPAVTNILPRVEVSLRGSS